MLLPVEFNEEFKCEWMNESDSIRHRYYHSISLFNDNSSYEFQIKRKDEKGKINESWEDIGSFAEMEKGIIEANRMLKNPDYKTFNIFDIFEEEVTISKKDFDNLLKILDGLTAENERLENENRRLKGN